MSEQPSSKENFFSLPVAVFGVDRIGMRREVYEVMQHRIADLQQDVTRYENGRVVLTGMVDDLGLKLQQLTLERDTMLEDIAALRMAERLNVETVAKLQHERDGLNERLDELHHAHDTLEAEHDKCGLAVPPKEPHVHSVVLDRLGWICSVCYGWNHQQDSHCTHTHAVTKSARPRGKPCTCDNCLGSSCACRVDAGEKLGELWYCQKRVAADPFVNAPLTGPGSRLEAQLAEPTCPPCRLELGGKRCDDCGYAPRLCGHDDGSQCDETCAEKVRAFREYHGLPPKRVAPETNESHSK